MAARDWSKKRLQHYLFRFSACLGCVLSVGSENPGAISSCIDVFVVLRPSTGRGGEASVYWLRGGVMGFNTSKAMDAASPGHERKVYPGMSVAWRRQ